MQNQPQRRTALDSDGDGITLYQPSSPDAYKQMLLRLSRAQQARQAQRQPGLAQLWCWMLEYQDRQYFLSDRALRANQTPDQQRVYRLFSLENVCSTLPVKRPNNLLNPERYSLLGDATGYYKSDLNYYLAQPDIAKARMDEDLAAIQPNLQKMSVTAPDSRVLLVAIAIILDKPEVARQFIEQYSLTVEQLQFPDDTVLGSFLPDAVTKLTQAQWNQYTQDDLVVVAKQGDHDKLTRILAQANIDVNHANGTALYHAVGKGHLECVLKLLAHGAKVDRNHFFAAGYAKTNTSTTTVAALKSALVKHSTSRVNIKDGKPLYDALSSGDKATAKELIEAGANVTDQHFFAAGWAANKHGKDTATSLRKLLILARQNQAQQTLANTELNAAAEQTSTNAKKAGM